MPDGSRVAASALRRPVCGASGHQLETKPAARSVREACGWFGYVSIWTPGEQLLVASVAGVRALVLQLLRDVPSKKIFFQNYLAAVTLVAADMIAFLNAPSMVTAKL
jgi:hypothetical protein